MKPLSERDENTMDKFNNTTFIHGVGMKPLSERDENMDKFNNTTFIHGLCRNEATLWKRWEQKRQILLFHGVFNR